MFREWRAIASLVVILDGVDEVRMSSQLIGKAATSCRIPIIYAAPPAWPRRSSSSACGGREFSPRRPARFCCNGIVEIIADADEILPNFTITSPPLRPQRSAGLPAITELIG